MDKFHIIIAIIVVVLVSAFIGKIALNSTEHKTYVKDFKEKCEEKNGVPYYPKGVKGWAEYICFSKEAVINIRI